MSASSPQSFLAVTFSLSTRRRVQDNGESPKQRIIVLLAFENVSNHFLRTVGELEAGSAVRPRSSASFWRRIALRERLHAMYSSDLESMGKRGILSSSPVPDILQVRTEF